MGARTALAETLALYMRDGGYRLDRLARDATVPKQTLSRWLTGTSARPHQWQPLLQVAATLGLNRARTERLLRAAGQPSLATLLARDHAPGDAALLALWRVAAPHNLPAALTSFFGREDEVLDVAERLADPIVRLLTLTGPGGSGKTRLALAVADAILDAFPDGVWFVPLAPLTEPALILPAIAQALRIGAVPSMPLADRLADSLRPRRTLLLLDNFEQVRDAGPAITTLLTAAPGLKVLVTSRTILHLSGEHEWPVAPLAPPQPGASFAMLIANPAVMLFAARARAAHPAFALTRANAAPVAALCARLDGLPLALELAAARVRRFPPEELLARFGSRLALGSDGPRDISPRQRTLRATVAWSGELLTPRERRLFARLSVFAGGCTPDAAVAVCGEAGDGAEVFADLVALREASLLERAQRPNGALRYGMLETIREYATEQLAVSGERETVRDHHAAYVLEQLPTPRPYVPGVQQVAWQATLQDEVDNLRAALGWSLAHGQRELAARLAGASWPFWHETTRFVEGNGWLQAALAAGAGLPASLRAPLATGLLVLTFSEGDYGRCVELGDEAAVLWTGLGDRHGLGVVTLYQALNAQNRGDFAGARAFYEQSLAHWRALDDPSGLIVCLSHLAFMLSQYGEFAAAEEHFAAVHALCTRHDDRAGLARWAIDRGLSIMMQGHFHEARGLLQQGLDLSRELYHPFNVPAALCYLGLATLLDGEPNEAAGYLGESLRLRRDSGDRFGIVYCLIGLAGVANLRHQAARAARLCGAAAALQTALAAIIPPGPGLLYEGQLALVRESLGAEGFAQAWATGQALAPEAAIAEALEEAGA